MMLILRVTVEYGKPAGLFYPKTQSWAFLFGDSIAVPVAFGAAAMYPYTSSLSRGTKIAFAVGIAFCACILFRRTDSERYRKSGNTDRLLSPTKLWHDFVVYPLLTAVLVFQGLPVLVSRFGTTECWLVLAGVTVWGMLGLVDLVIIKPDPAKQHPRWQDTALHRFNL